MKSLIKKYNL